MYLVSIIIINFKEGTKGHFQNWDCRDLKSPELELELELKSLELELELELKLFVSSGIGIGIGIENNGIGIGIELKKWNWPQPCSPPFPDISQVIHRPKKYHPVPNFIHWNLSPHFVMHWNRKSVTNAVLSSMELWHTGHLWGESLEGGQWCGTLMFSLLLAWTSRWTKRRVVGDLRRDYAHVTSLKLVWWKFTRLYIN